MITPKKITQLFIFLTLILTGNGIIAGQNSNFQHNLSLIQTAFSEATQISEKQPMAGEGEIQLFTVYKNKQIIGYAFESNDVVNIPAYSGKPVNTLISIDTQGEILSADVIEHHEPILLIGIPEERLFEFTEHYPGLNVNDQVHVGQGGGDGSVSVDAITGATVTVIVLNDTIMSSSRKVASSLGIAGLSTNSEPQRSTIKDDFFKPLNWQQLSTDGSIQHLKISRGEVDEAFIDTEAAHIDKATTAQKDSLFIELYYAPLNIPTIGKNLLGEREYRWLMKELEPGDQAITILGKGRYSFKGSAYVRGGIFDRIQVQQRDKNISFRDSDYHRITSIEAEGSPGFDEMVIFIVRDHYQFDLGSPWKIELLVRRQIGALDSLFTRFKGSYLTPEIYINRPAPLVEEVAEPLWVSVWRGKTFQITVLLSSLVLLTATVFLQDWLVRYPKLLRYLRHSFLIYTTFFIGWYTLGQLSIVNVFTFTHALLGDFRWEMFLLDPMLFILWSFVAISILLWGRGIFCGWLCPFGALQELINEASRALKIKQFELPFSIHERLWAIKYLVLLALFAISLGSLTEAERYAEIEPFKTTFLLKFQREWGFVLYAGVLLLLSIFTRKIYCRYICPLGAALAIPSKLSLFNWLKRYQDCGQPCRICDRECEIKAIQPDGKINTNECHYCLDCQVTYHNQKRCPALLKRGPNKQQRDKLTTTINR
jgi:NosR/NirI family nitrous oxide reductase transcriptional regulator